jgi:hypothetical protein
VKKHIAVAVAGAAAAIAGGLRLVQELVHREDDYAGSAGSSPSRPDDPATGSSPATSSPRTTGSASAGKGSGAGGKSGGGAAKATEPVPAKATKAELYAIAQELDIEGRSKMSKAELVEAIRRAS